MNKDLSMSMLMDFYGQLLTEKQKITLDLYYNQDYSLSEIAEYADITRQGVHDSIKRGEKQLKELESELGLVRRFNDICADVERIEHLLSELEKDTDGMSGAEYISEIKKICANIRQTL